MLIILQIFFATGAVLKLGEYYCLLPNHDPPAPLSRVQLTHDVTDIIRTEVSNTIVLLTLNTQFTAPFNNMRTLNSKLNRQMRFSEAGRSRRTFD